MKSANEIAELAAYVERQRGTLHARRVRVRDLYGGDIAVPLPELSKNEEAAIANLLRLGLDGTSQRIASNTPEVKWAPVRPGFKQHEDDARRRHQVSMGWWECSAMDLIDLRRARHLVGYAESPVEIRWDKKRNAPYWWVADPLNTYSAPQARLDDMCPEWVLYCFSQPLSWVRRNYPIESTLLRAGDANASTVIKLVKYHDGEETVLVAVGRKQEEYGYDGYTSTTNAVELERVPNIVGMTTCVVPGRIGLTEDRLGQMDGMIPKYVRQARLDALQTIAIEEGIFPKQWLVARQGERPKVITVADPRKGIVGQVEGGDLITTNVNPGYKTDSAIASLERDQRLEAGIPATFGGEAISGSRSARQSEIVEGGAIDFGIMEAQKILARSKEIELRVAAEMAKAYAGNVTVSLYVTAKAAKGQVSYKAKDLFSSTEVKVRYPYTGSDESQRVAINSAKLANNLISEQTAREQDPQVENAELEKDRITFEALEKAALTGVQTMAASAMEAPGALEQVARIGELVKTDKLELIDAVIKATKEFKERQAQQAPEVPEGMAAAPEMMPGLGGPAGPMEAPVETPPDLAGLASRLGGAIAGQAA